MFTQSQPGITYKHYREMFNIPQSTSIVPCNTDKFEVPAIVVTQNGRYLITQDNSLFIANNATVSVKKNIDTQAEVVLACYKLEGETSMQTQLQTEQNFTETPSKTTSKKKKPSSSSE